MSELMVFGVAVISGSWLVGLMVGAVARVIGNGRR